MIDSSATIDEFLNAAAGKRATPGGGAVAALAGALAASMGEMVLNYSVTKKDLLQFSEPNRQALAELTRARGVLVQLMLDDQLWYGKYSEAKKAKQDEDAAIALRYCVLTPRLIGQTALEILKIGNRIVATSNRWLHSDLAVCGELATATVRCAIHNIRVNLPELEPAERARYEDECRRLLKQAVDEVSRLIVAINQQKS